MQNELKIFHIYANDINIGDFASAQGIRLFLEKNYNGKILFYDKFATTDLSFKDIDFINKNMDGVVIGGGGLLRGDSKTKKNHILGLSFEKLDLIKKPVFTYSIGVNYEKSFSEGILNAAEFLTKKAVFNAVRDNMSKDILKNSEIVMCPSMFIEEPRKTAIADKISIGIVPVPISRVSNPENYVSRLIELIDNLEKTGYGVRIITHSKFPEDVHYEINKHRKINLFLPSNPSVAMHFYQECDIVIGSRGHSLIFATGQLIPFVNASYNIKCDEFCKAIRYLPDLSFGISDDGDEWSCINEKIKYIVNNYENIRALLGKAKNEGEFQNDNYSQKIIKYLENYAKH